MQHSIATGTSPRRATSGMQQEGGKRAVLRARRGAMPLVGLSGLGGRPRPRLALQTSCCSHGCLAHARSAAAECAVVVLRRCAGMRERRDDSVPRAHRDALIRLGRARALVRLGAPSCGQPRHYTGSSPRHARVRLAGALQRVPQTTSRRPNVVLHPLPPPSARPPSCAGDPLECGERRAVWVHALIAAGWVHPIRWSPPSGHPQSLPAFPPSCCIPARPRRVEQVAPRRAPP